MNYPMVRKLALKDLHLNRFFIAGYIVSGLVALTAARFGDGAVFYASCVLLITVLLGLGAHMTMATVLQERNDKTLPFIMSLPITVHEYTAAKVFANLLIFIIPWVPLLAGCIFVIDGNPTLSNGLIPLVTIIMGIIFVGYVLLLAVAMVTESVAWTVVFIIVCNLILQLIIYRVPRMETMKAHFQSATAVWNSSALGLLTVEAVLSVLILGILFVCQSRKKDFI